LQEHQRGFGVCSGVRAEVGVVLPLLPEQVLFEAPQPGGGRRGGGVVEALGLVGGRRGQAQTGRRRSRMMVPPDGLDLVAITKRH